MSSTNKTNVGSVKVRRSQERGHAQHGWLDSYHTFSFADYYDPAHMGYRSLRVINEDWIAPNQGFGMHPHRDMEIFSYVLEGRLAHKDTMGNGRELAPGDVQLMSAGSGVAHSEINPSATDPIHLLQIWILPDTRGLKPSYTEWKPTEEKKNDSKVLMISDDGREDSAVIHQDAAVYRLRPAAGEVLQHELAEGRGAWVQVISGSLQFGDVVLNAGDAASTDDAGLLEIKSLEASEALLFDLK